MKWWASRAAISAMAPQPELVINRGFGAILLFPDPPPLAASMVVPIRSSVTR